MIWNRACPVGRSKCITKVKVAVLAPKLSGPPGISLCQIAPVRPWIYENSKQSPPYAQGLFSHHRLYHTKFDYIIVYDFVIWAPVCAEEKGAALAQNAVLICSGEKQECLV